MQIKAQVGKIETLSDNTIKLSLSIQPESAPDNIFKLRFEDVMIVHGETLKTRDDIIEAVRTAATAIIEALDSESKEA